MSSALNCAKYFLKRGLDTNRNTYDGNMKIQKLLFFANYISILNNHKPLFEEPVIAFSNGCVVESVRLRYRNDCLMLCKESESFEPEFSQEEYDALNLAIEIFGDLSARELSNLNHTFSFWKNALARSECNNGFKDKSSGVIHKSEMELEADKLQTVIQAYLANKSKRSFKELINGITFYYDPELELTDEIINELETFSRQAEENAYSVYQDEEGLVIY